MESSWWDFREHARRLRGLKLPFTEFPQREIPRHGEGDRLAGIPPPSEGVPESIFNAGTGRSALKSEPKLLASRPVLPGVRAPNPERPFFLPKPPRPKYTLVPATLLR